MDRGCGSRRGAHVSMESGRFAEEKARALAQVDLSRKGSVDAAIVELVRYINSLPAYYTTSSCSGRITVFSQGGQSRKQGCVWLLTSHVEVTLAQLELSLGDLPGGYTYFKFEPFVLHCMCSTLEHAQRMLQLAIGAGFRNSGITCGRKKRIMLAVRSTHSLEAPLACDGRLIVSKEYLQHLVTISNEKLQENLTRVDKFSEELHKSLSSVGKEEEEGEGESRQHTSKEDKVKPAKRVKSTQNSTGSHDIIKQDHGLTDTPIEEELTHLFAI